MTDSVSDIKTLMLRDLQSMREQVQAYPEDALLWKTLPGIDNSAGTLVLHCVGNLRHFVGEALGGTGYERDRDREFAARDLPRQELLDLLDAAARDVTRGLDALSASGLGDSVGLPGGRSTTRGRFLHHLCTHLAYHLGQLDYHRRVVTGAGPVPGTVGLGAL